MGKKNTDQNTAEFNRDMYSRTGPNDGPNGPNTLPVDPPNQPPADPNAPPPNQAPGPNDPIYVQPDPPPAPTRPGPNDPPVHGPNDQLSEIIQLPKEAIDVVQDRIQSYAGGYGPGQTEAPVQEGHYAKQERLRREQEGQ